MLKLVALAVSFLMLVAAIMLLPVQVLVMFTIIVLGGLVKTASK